MVFIAFGFVILPPSTLNAFISSAYNEFPVISEVHTGPLACASYNRVEQRKISLDILHKHKQNSIFPKPR